MVCIKGECPPPRCCIEGCFKSLLAAMLLPLSLSFGHDFQTPITAMTVAAKVLLMADRGSVRLTELQSTQQIER